MCGRFALIVDAAVLADVFEVDPPRDLKPRFNIAPTQSVPVVRHGEQGREAVPLRWGLVPSWAKDVKMGARMINARGETVAQKPSFRSAVKTRRCLVPTSGFYEWVTTADGKQPHFIHFADGRAFAFGGLWERWSKSDDGPLETFTIITTSPNPLIAELHDRMPVILDPASWDQWLEPAPISAEALENLIAPHPADDMEAYPVGRHVNSPRNDDPECLVRV
jgi:putative SOS response-associated peptidase YedK